MIIKKSVFRALKPLVMDYLRTVGLGRSIVTFELISGYLPIDTIDVDDENLRMIVQIRPSRAGLAAFCEDATEAFTK